MNERLIGLILAGGKSSRMGFDKTTLMVNGVPVIEHLKNGLKEFCSQILLSCKREEPDAYGLDLLFDEYSFGGPLNGIMTGLKTHPNHDLLVVAADQPFVDRQLIEQLVSKSNSATLVSAFFNSERKMPEPFPSIWRASSFQLLETFIADHRPSPLDFMLQSEVEVIAASNQSFTSNLNSPKDLKKFSQITRQ